MKVLGNIFFFFCLVVAITFLFFSLFFSFIFADPFFLNLFGGWKIIPLDVLYTRSYCILFSFRFILCFYFLFIFFFNSESVTKNEESKEKVNTDIFIEKEQGEKVQS